MRVEFYAGAANVKVIGSAQSVSRIRKSIEYAEHMNPIFDELDSVRDILPVAGASGAVNTIRAMKAEIAKLRHKVQVQNNIKEVEVSNDE